MKVHDSRPHPGASGTGGAVAGPLLLGNGHAGHCGSPVAAWVRGGHRALCIRKSGGNPERVGRSVFPPGNLAPGAGHQRIRTRDGEARR